ncbi:Gfo/Idh/MocA family oxidoreductase [Geotalea sp. SG265]|uniref:Gfo/Idh/MocA family protein n=1 Tax=Geotalea sp. SG265 TaxID=2922867 RepID=UPI001FAF096A|nr:Gfo/Idh/MocA family oxidoreductase [Geotalea sp. SG265]
MQSRDHVTSSERAPTAGAKVRVGILGCSDIARRKFIPALAQAKGAVLRGIASRDPAQAAATWPNLPVEPVGYGELLADPQIQLVYLSPPNHLHEEFVLRALQAGKHVICEKPLGLSLASVRKMLACAEKRGLLLFENLMYLHHPQHAAVKEIIDGDAIGTVRTVRSVFTFPAPAVGNFRLDPARGGGAFHDLARYAVGTAWFFLKGAWRSFRGYALDQNDLNVAIHGTALTTAGEIFSCSLAFGQPYESSYEIVGEEGSIRVDRAYTTPPEMANRIRVISGGKDISFTVPPADHFRLMIEDVCTMVLGGGDFTAARERNLQLASMAEQMRKGCHHEELRR